MNLLEIINLKKNYYTLQGEMEAIKDISFEVKQGEFLVIVGSSGCGKSTLLNIIANLDTLTSGTIKGNDGIVIGYMLQEDALLPWLNILDNALLGLKIQNKNNEENKKYVINLLKTYGLGDYLNKYPDELSGGMKQRVALIRTLAIKPDLLLLDEPFSALDYQSRITVADDVYKIIKKEKKTVIMITHDIGEAVAIADRIIVLSKRPAVIKKEYDIILTDKKSPLSNRNCIEFNTYYNQIWKDLDENV